MFILQSIRNFIDNPMGKGSNAIPSRQLIKDDLNRRFASLFSHKEKKMGLEIYKDKEDYYFHFKVPSESKERKNTYDVVLQFTTGDEKEIQSDKNLNRYYVKFFSNSPSFTYTFAHAFNVYGMFIEELANKYRKEVMDKPPMTRNPAQVVSYEKSIYFAAHYLITENKYLNKLIIDPIAKPFKAKEFAKLIRNTDVIELEIKKEQRRVHSEKEKEKESLGRGTTKEKTVSGKKENKLGGQSKSSKVTSSKGKITPRKSSITKIKPR
jgi:hypothetical protein